MTVPVTSYAPAVPTEFGVAPQDCLVLHAGTRGIFGAPDAVAGQPIHFAFGGDSADKGQLQHKLGRRSVDACYDQVSLAREDRKILDLTGAPR